MKIQMGKQQIKILGGPLPLSVDIEGHVLVFPLGIDPARVLREAMFAFWETLGPVKIEALNPDHVLLEGK